MAHSKDGTERTEVDELIEKALDRLDAPTTRRGFLKMTGLAAAGLLASSLFGKLNRAAGAADNFIILENATGLIVADPTRCVGCRRCEIACSSYNDGVSQAHASRIKVGRNLNFGPRGASYGFWLREGEFGNLRIIQDTCKQCPHPVPCEVACPNGAIDVSGPVNARVVDESKCVGCGMCARACPWEMITVNKVTSKATKCTLCGGKPECVAECPTGAIKYISWRDLTRETPIRQTGLAMSPTKADSCSSCH